MASFPVFMLRKQMCMELCKDLLSEVKVSPHFSVSSKRFYFIR